MCRQPSLQWAGLRMSLELGAALGAYVARARDAGLAALAPGERTELRGAHGAAKTRGIARTRDPKPYHS